MSPGKRCRARAEVRKRQATTRNWFVKILLFDVLSPLKQRNREHTPNKPGQKSKASCPLARRIWIGGGSFFLGVGIVGVFLPLLPTTPFLLLAAACYARGSERFYNWLLGNKWFGDYIRNYREGKGIPLRVKMLTISLLWATIGYSTAFVATTLPLRIVLVLIAAGVTTHILLMKTLHQ